MGFTAGVWTIGLPVSGRFNGATSACVNGGFWYWGGTRCRNIARFRWNPYRAWPNSPASKILRLALGATRCRHPLDMFTTSMRSAQVRAEERSAPLRFGIPVRDVRRRTRILLLRLLNASPVPALAKRLQRRGDLILCL